MTAMSVRRTTTPLLVFLACGVALALAVQFADDRIDRLRGLVLAELALRDHARRGQPEADGAGRKTLDEGRIVRPPPAS